MGDSNSSDIERLVRGITLAGVHEGLVKRFDGFDKSRHTVPKFASDRAQQFLGRLAEPELIEWGESLFASYRETMDYRRKDISLAVDGGVARIESKDFVLERRFTLVEESPDSYQVETELLNASSLELLSDEGFNQATGDLFERMRCMFRKSVLVEDIVDGLESDSEWPISIEYPSTCVYCDVRIDNIDAVFRFEPASLEIRYPRFGTPMQLANAFETLKKGLDLVPEVSALVGF